MTKGHFILDIDLTLDFTLWGIHTDLAGYALAFNLNKTLHSHFKRARRDLTTTENQFSFYQWDEPQKGIYCELLQNSKQQQLQEATEQNNLFEVETTKEVYLLPEVKQAPFLLKIHEGISPNTIKKSIAHNTDITLFYALDDEQLKTKLNIFTLK